MHPSNSDSVRPRHRIFRAFVVLFYLAFATVTAQAELDIHVTSHQVWWFAHHSKIVVTYDQPDECTGCDEDQIREITSDMEGCFTSDTRTVTSDRRNVGYCTTIGAGSKPKGRKGKLFGETNRPSGLRNELTSDPTAITPPSNSTLQNVLQNLLTALNAHTEEWNCFEGNEEKRMDYDLIPGDGYNSNSFISGIAKFVGLSPAELKPDVWVPGYEKPVLEARFEFSDCPSE